MYGHMNRQGGIEKEWTQTSKNKINCKRETLKTPTAN